MTTLLTKAETRLRLFLKLLYLLALLAIFFHVFHRLLPGAVQYRAEQAYQLVANGSLLQACLLVLILAVAIGDIRRFSHLVRLLTWLAAIAALLSVVAWIFFYNPAVSTRHYLGRTIVYFAVAVGLALLFHAAEKARYGLKYLTIQQFQTLESIAEVCIAGDTDTGKLPVQPIDVASNVDTYLSTFRANSKWIMKLVLTAMEVYPLLSLHLPLSFMRPADRLEFLKKRFLSDVEFRMMPDWYRQLVQAAIRMSKQLCYMGYYSDARVYNSIGYTPFSKRPDMAARFGDFPLGHSLSDQLQVMQEGDIGEAGYEGDVVIAGSGAAASILASQLVAMGRKVLLVEKGQFELPKSFNEDEVDMVSRLYANGALQISRDFRFQVFQGSCVGGSTVVNNAVCFETPAYVLDRWIGEMGIDIDRGRYEQSMKEVYRIMRVAHTPEMTIDKYLNPGGILFSEACKKLGYHVPDLDSVMANIDGCLGCGYCNMGCKYGRKLSMLDTVLPRTQMDNPGRLEILAGCEAISFNRGKDGKSIVSLTGQFGSGKKITITGNTFVASAGAISSSILLIKSKLGIANAGKKLAFNLGSQITAQYPQVVNSFDGLQISHFLKTGDRRYVMETWYNPPMFQSTAMPGWFEQHFHNMQQYGHMACTGVLVGTASNAEVRVAGLLGREIDYVPTEDDFDSLMDALGIASEIYLEAGASKVMPNTFNYYEYNTVPDLKDRLRKDVKSSRDISTGTGHPQGGNVMSNDPATGVVDKDFKVFGFDNLFVCDASVFPTSLGVNPQVTVMSLAHYAAPIIADCNRPPA